MTPVFEMLEPIVVASMRHVGPHDPAATGATWEELILWASPRRLLGRSMEIRGVGLLWDDPRVWPAERRRYDVGIPIDAGDASSVEPPAFINVTLPGEYLKVVHEGAYDGIVGTLKSALDIELRIEDLELVAAPIIELYRNSPQEVEEEQLRTDLYLPVTELD